MYFDAGHVIETLYRILNAEQEFFREYARPYQQDIAERQFPLTIQKGKFPTRPMNLMPLLELEPTGEENEWATTRGQRPTCRVTMYLTIVNSNPSFVIEYMTGWVRRLKTILCDPRRLQSRVVDREGHQQLKWDLNDGLVPLYFLDSLIDSVTYSSLQGGSIRQAELNWWCKLHLAYPPEAFQDHWPHYTT